VTKPDYRVVASAERDMQQKAAKQSATTIGGGLGSEAGYDVSPTWRTDTRAYTSRFKRNVNAGNG
jgi:hypothetical protein